MKNIVLLLLLSSFLFSCGSLEFSRHRYTKGFHINLSGNKSDQKVTLERRPKATRVKVSAVADSQIFIQICEKNDTLPKVYEESQVIEQENKEEQKGIKKLFRHVRSSNQPKQQTQSIVNDNTSAYVQESGRTSTKETDFTGTHVVVGILSLMLLIGFLAAHGWVEAIFFVILVLIAILAAALEIDDCCLW